MTRFRTMTYGGQIDIITREIERLGEVVKRHPRRAGEIEQGRAMLARLTAQMQRLGKRRSSCFYGFEEVSA